MFVKYHPDFPGDMKETHNPPIDWWHIEDPSSKSLVKECSKEIEPGQEFEFIVVLRSLAKNMNQLFVTNIKIWTESKPH